MSEATAVQMPAGNNGRTAEGKFAAGNVYRMQPGETRNRAGRPPKLLTQELERVLMQQLPHDANGTLIREKLGLPKRCTWLMALAKSMVMAALTDPDVAQGIIDRIEGKPTTPVQLTGHEGPIDIRVVYEKSEFKP